MAKYFPSIRLSLKSTQDMTINIRILLVIGIISIGFSGLAAPIDTRTFPAADVPRPGYSKPFLDPVFASEVTRITGDPGTAILNIDSVWDPVARHQYSKVAAWNANQSLLLLSHHHGYPSMLFLDGSSYQPVFGRNVSPGTEIRWHPLKPDTLVYVKDNAIGYWNPVKDTTEVVAEFGKEYSDFHIGPWEGNLSQDGRWIVVVGRKGAIQVAFAYDLKKRRKYPDLVLDDVTVDWASISASGKFIVLNGKIRGDTGDQTQVYDLGGNKVGKLWGNYGRPSHYDLTLDSEGEDIAVGVSKYKSEDGQVIKRRLRDGKVTVLTVGGYASHTSARNLGRPGWVYVTYQYSGPNWPPYWDEVVAVKLDGSQTVERIAQMHANSTDYLTEAQAVPSPDGERILWASAWGAPSGRPIGAFVARRKNADR